MAVRDHGFHALRIARVVAETDDAATFVLVRWNATRQDREHSHSVDGSAST